MQKKENSIVTWLLLAYTIFVTPIVAIWCYNLLLLPYLNYELNYGLCLSVIFLYKSFLTLKSHSYDINYKNSFTIRTIVSIIYPWMVLLFSWIISLFIH